MERSTRVVLAIEAPEVLDEVLHFLDRSGAVRVVAAADGEGQIVDAVTQLEPDLVIAEPRFAGAVPGPTPCIAIASRESIAALRAAIAAGVRGFTVWPEERDRLMAHVEGFAVGAKHLERRAAVIAVHASRGGAGCTFVATHLARAAVSAERSVVLVDVDPFGGDVATALGIADGTEGLHPVSELCDVVDEMTPGSFTEAVFRHHEGFGVIVAAPPEAPTLEERSVLHTGLGTDLVTRACLRTADAVAEVLALDIASFRATVRTLARIASDGVEDRTSFVVNRAARGEVVPADVERVFGRAPDAVLPLDASVPRLQDHGRLLPPRARAARAIARLSDRMLASTAELRGAA
jgi:MinD-like ATPase involved in chromosome partitioning or flagellar assembly/CheY-like chemotaxis protein